MRVKSEEGSGKGGQGEGRVTFVPNHQSIKRVWFATVQISLSVQSFRQSSRNTNICFFPQYNGAAFYAWAWQGKALSTGRGEEGSGRNLRAIRRLKPIHPAACLSLCRLVASPAWHGLQMEASSWEHPYPTLPDPIPLAERRNTAAATLFLDCLISCEMCLQPVTWLPPKCPSTAGHHPRIPCHSPSKGQARRNKAQWNYLENSAQGAQSRSKLFKVASAAKCVWQFSQK